MNIKENLKALFPVEIDQCTCFTSTFRVNAIILMTLYCILIKNHCNYSVAYVWGELLNQQQIKYNIVVYWSKLINYVNISNILICKDYSWLQWNSIILL